MYELTDPAVVNALIDAHRRGVDTKVILDAAFHGHGLKRPGARGAGAVARGSYPRNTGQHLPTALNMLQHSMIGVGNWPEGLSRNGFRPKAAKSKQRYWKSAERSNR
jgi:hypothetical protein